MQSNGTPYGLIRNASIVVEAGRVEWCGPGHQLSDQFSQMKSEDIGGRLVTPALIDCHTHIIYGGNRAREFEQRLSGVSYEDIARQGGGINSTVRATRAASDEELIESALKRIDVLMSEGVRVIEIKSGYGLTIADEIRMLRIARALQGLRNVVVKTTWLAAHALPAEFSGRTDAYIDDVVIPGLEQAHREGLVDAVDGFCEEIAFSRAQIEKVFDAAASMSLPIKLHAEQLTNQQGAVIVAKYRGLSADHLEFLSEDDVKTFAQGGSVAVLLPGAFYFLKETQKPPIEALRREQVPMAVATDCNPGSSPISSLLTVMNMACVLFGLTPEEALAGVTRNAAKALNVEPDYGSIQPGALADFAVWNLRHPAELASELGGSALQRMLSHEVEK